MLFYQFDGPHKSLHEVVSYYYAKNKSMSPHVVSFKMEKMPCSTKRYSRFLKYRTFFSIKHSTSWERSL